MNSDIEITTLDLRYQGFRMKHRANEARLLDSIAQRGIEEPLEGVDLDQQRVLLNGFKRYRCALKLRVGAVPYRSLGQDEVSGIMDLLRLSTTKTLGILEQAAFLDELKNLRGMNLAQIAQDLMVSKAWVSMRLGLISSMSQEVRRQLFEGAFPVYSYMYLIRRFMRMNRVSPKEVESFITALSGHGLSVREIEQLAHGFFRGPDSFRQQILSGNLALPLERMKQAPQDPDSCDNEFERVLLGDLEIIQKYMQRVMGKSLDPRLKSRAFHAQSHLLTAGILSRCGAFAQTVKQLHDRNGQA